jgi:hypothetical protein
MPAHWMGLVEVEAEAQIEVPPYTEQQVWAQQPVSACEQVPIQHQEPAWAQADARQEEQKLEE